MARKDREKLRKSKARKAKRVEATKAAKAGAKDASTTGDPGKTPHNHPFTVDSVGKSVGGGAPRMPRRSKKG